MLERAEKKAFSFSLLSICTYVCVGFVDGDLEEIHFACFEFCACSGVQPILLAYDHSHDEIKSAAIGPTHRRAPVPPPPPPPLLLLLRARARRGEGE